MSFVWTTGSRTDSPSPPSSCTEIWLRIAVSAEFMIGILYLSLVIRIFRSFIYQGVLPNGKGQRVESENVEDRKGARYIIIHWSSEILTGCLLDMRELLDTLPHVSKAKYDPELQCLPGTRVKFIQNIVDCVISMDTSNVCWLTGQAGMGKTAIATTISHYFDQVSRLGATFSFHRDGEELCKPDEIFSSIAYQLALFDTYFFAEICMTLANIGDVRSYSISDQFKILIQEPLYRTAETRPPSLGPIIVVLDALDECVIDHSRNKIFRVILDGVRHLPNFIKFIITSRPHPDLQVAFGTMRSSFNLDDDRFSLTNQDDIGHIVMTELSDVSQSRDLDGNWGDELRSIVRQADGFILWAKAVCDMIKDDDVERPDMLLQLILDPSAGATMDPLLWRTLDTCYRRAFEQSITTQTLLSQLERLQEVLGTIILLFSRLSVGGIARLLNLHSADAVRRRLRNLYSVVMIPAHNQDYPSIIHSSLIEFLTDPSRCIDARFYIDPIVHHGRLAKRCLVRMMQEGGRRLEADSIHDELDYAIRNWATHLSRSSYEESELYDLVHTYASDHIPHWFEMLGSPDIAQSLLQDVMVWAQVVVVPQLL
jgi:NACHT domain